MYFRSSAPMPAISKARLPVRRIAGLEWKFCRSSTCQISWASAQPCRYTHLDSGTPSSRALSTLAISTPADWSTSMMAFSSLGYGKPIIRLRSLTVVSSSADRRVGNQAWGFSAATSVKRSNSAPIRAAWSGSERPSRARSAFSKMG